MIESRYSIITVLLLLVVVTGCVHHHVISELDHSITSPILPSLTSSDSVALIAEIQNRKDPLLICRDGIDIYVAREVDLIGMALTFLKDILTRNNIEIHDNGDKRLILSVVDVRCESGFWAMDYEARIMVRAGKHVSKEFMGCQSTSDITGTTWAVEKALAKAVMAMFKDREIIDYLKGTPTAD